MNIQKNHSFIVTYINALTANFARAASILFLACVTLGWVADTHAQTLIPKIKGFYTTFSYPTFNNGPEACTYHLSKANTGAEIYGHAFDRFVMNATGENGQCFYKKAGNTQERAVIVFRRNFLCPPGTSPSTSEPDFCVVPEPDCPAAGTDAGVTNVTVGWSNTSRENGPVQTWVIQDGSPGNASFCENSCGIKNSAFAEKCWRSLEPSATGLYRLSCDFPMEQTGQRCSPSPSSPDPAIATPAPPCNGSSGTVNGQYVCLDSSSTPNTITPKPVPGNPTPGTKGGGNTSESVDPVTGAGTGSGGTGAGGGSGGSGGSGDGGSGNGNTGNVNVVVNVPDTMKINEAGTPNGSETGVKDADLKAVTDSRIGEMEKKQSSLGFDWKLQLPQGACEPWTVSILMISHTFDWCARLQGLRDIIGWVYVFITMIAIWQAGIAAVKFNRG